MLYLEDDFVPKSGEFKNPSKELSVDITKSFEKVAN